MMGPRTPLVLEEIIMNARLPERSLPQREILERYLPLLLAMGVASLLAHGLKKMFWTAFGLFWMFHWNGFWPADRRRCRGSVSAAGKGGLP